MFRFLRVASGSIARLRALCFEHAVIAEVFNVREGANGASRRTPGTTATSEEIAMKTDEVRMAG